MGIFGKSDSERAKELNEKSEENPGSVVSEISELIDLLESSDEEARLHASTALSRVAKVYPGEARGASSKLVKLLQDQNPRIRVSATSGLTWIAKEYPEEAKNLVKHVSKGFNDKHERTRKNCVVVLYYAAKHDPEEALPYVDHLGKLLGDSNDVIRQNAAKILYFVSKEHPQEVTNLVNPLVQAIFNDSEQNVRRDASKAITKIAQSNSESVKPESSKLMNLLSYEDTVVRRQAGGALVYISDGNSEIFNADGVARYLSHNDPKVRYYAAGILANVANKRPDEVSRWVDSLVSLTNDNDPEARMGATIALNNLAEEKPGSVRFSAENLKQNLRDSNESVRVETSGIFRKIAEEFPVAAKTAVSELTRLLTDTNPSVRVESSAALYWISTEYPDELRSSVVDLVKASGYDNPAVKSQSLAALANIAAEHPDEVMSKIDTSEIVESLHEDDVWTRKNGLLLIEQIAREHPDEMKEAVPALNKLLNDTDEEVRDRAVFILVLIGYGEGDSRPKNPGIAEHIETEKLLRLLDSRGEEKKNTRNNAAGVIYLIQEYEPEKAKSAIPKLAERLEKEEAEVTRATVARTLTNLATEYPEMVRSETGRSIDEIKKIGWDEKDLKNVGEKGGKDEGVDIDRESQESEIDEDPPDRKDRAEDISDNKFLDPPPEIDFSDVGGMNDLIDDLKNKIIKPLKEPEKFEKFDLGAVNGVLLYGPPGTGKTYISKALAGELGYNYIEIDPSDIISKWVGEAPNVVKKVFKTAKQNQPCLLFIDEIDAIAGDRGSDDSHKMQKDTVNQLLTELSEIQGEDIVVIAATNMLGNVDDAIKRSGRFNEKIEVPRPDEDARREILSVHLRDRPVDESVDIDMLAEMTEGYSASDLELIAERSARKAVMSDEKIRQKHLTEAVEETEKSGQDVEIDSEYLEEVPELDFGDVGGMSELKDNLSEKIIEPLENPERFEEYDIDVTNGVLLHGPPGCGKTYISRALAGELGYNFIDITPSDITSELVGKASDNVEEVFRVAKRNQPCLIFVDEIDAIAGSRSSGAKKTQSERQMVNQLLTELSQIDDEEIVVIGATNLLKEVDDAIKRSGRFDEKIEVPPPDQEARREILEQHLEERPVNDEIDWNRITEKTRGYASSDIELIAQEGARLAMKRDKEITEEELIEAIDEVDSSLEKTRSGIGDDDSLEGPDRSYR